VLPRETSCRAYGTHLMSHSQPIALTAWPRSPKQAPAQNQSHSQPVKSSTMTAKTHCRAKPNQSSRQIGQANPKLHRKNKATATCFANSLNYQNSWQSNANTKIPCQIGHSNTKLHRKARTTVTRLANRQITKPRHKAKQPQNARSVDQIIQPNTNKRMPQDPPVWGPTANARRFYESPTITTNSSCKAPTSQNAQQLNWRPLRLARPWNRDAVPSAEICGSIQQA